MSNDRTALLAFLNAHFWPLWWLVVMGLILKLAGVEVMAQRMGRK